MPQIWLTYEELAALMGCGPAAARGAAVAVRLDRRKSRDGQTRVKLTPTLTEAFLEVVLRHRLEQEIAACAGNLRTVHERMAPQPAPASKSRAAISG